jgi:hypothetical protein
MATEFNHKLKAGLIGLGCSALSFSALAVPPITDRKISQQVVSQIIAGTKGFDSADDARDFLDVVNSMEYLQQIVQPQVPINWSNVLELKDILASIHEQRKNDMDPVSVQNFYVRLNVMNFFKRVNSYGVVTTINPEKDGAAFDNLGLAQRVVQELKRMDITAQVERLTGPRRKSSLTTSLEELGFVVKDCDNGTN